MPSLATFIGSEITQRRLSSVYVHDASHRSHRFNTLILCSSACIRWVSQCLREEEPDEEAAGMKSIASFMVQPKKKARANLFVKRGLELVDTF